MANLSGSKDMLATAPSTGANESGGSSVQPIDYAAFGKQLHSTMGIATCMSDVQYTQKFTGVAAVVGARTSAERLNLEISMAYYFAVHGTSPETLWSSYDKPFVFKGARFDAYQIVKIVGANSLKQFCARYSAHAEKLYFESSEFRSALSERVARIGLDSSEGVFVIDYYGKDGTLDPASMAVKSNARNRALRYRGSNTVGVATQRRTEEAENRVDQAPVVPTGLTKSFRTQQ